MPTWSSQELLLDIDDVLRGQGAEPSIIRERSPRLVENAQRALEKGRPYLEPQVLYQVFDAMSMTHKKLTLEGGYSLKGRLIAEHLGPAAQVLLMICTVGPSIEKYAAEVMKDDVVLGLALDGVGSAGVEALANAACRYFEDRKQKNGIKASIPLSPGMLGWPVDMGQKQIFDILDGNEIGVRLTDSYLMVPRKSLSMVLGFGEDMQTIGKTCDYCSMKDTCRYQDHYDPAAN